MAEVTYGRTALGQLIYDLGFTKLSEKYLARKHCLPISEIRKHRNVVKTALKPKRKKRNRPSAHSGMGK